MDLYEVTAAHLRASKKPYKTIAKDLGVSFRWVYGFADGEMKDPGVVKTQKLYTYLTGREIKLVAA